MLKSGVPGQALLQWVQTFAPNKQFTQSVLLKRQHIKKKQRAALFPSVFTPEPLEVWAAASSAELQCSFSLSVAAGSSCDCGRLRPGPSVHSSPTQYPRKAPGCFSFIWWRSSLRLRDELLQCSEVKHRCKLFVSSAVGQLAASTSGQM